MATKTTKPAASAAPTNTKDTNFTTETAEVENPKKNLTLTPPDASTPASDSISPSQEKPPTATGDIEGATNGTDTKAKETEAGSGLPSNDVEKKIRRAERFGVPVKLSEEEKRNSRAERFGTLTGSDGAKSSEDLKRKARADRFGLPANATTTTAAAAADEDAKKKARLARFGSSVKVDSQEEEKRKARALRFAKASANEKQKVEMETVAAGNTTGGA